METHYQQRINAVIDYVNENIDRPHSLDELANVASFSKYHFHRLFKNMTGETVHAFVKRLRLEHAVKMMRSSTTMTLTQVAMSTGFDSSSDFSRSFKAQYGFSPRDFSDERFRHESKICQDLAANLHYPLRSQTTSDNADRLEVQLNELEPSSLAYVRVFGAFNGERVLAGLNQLIDWARPNGLYPQSRLLSMSFDDMDTTPADKYRLDWCLRVPGDTKTDDSVSIRHFDGGLYASVHCVGDIELLDRAWQWLYRDWLPTSGFEPDHKPAMEWYVNDPFKNGWETFDMKCCIPIKQLA